MLPVLAAWPRHHQLSLEALMMHTVNQGNSPMLRSQYPPDRGAEVQQAILEAWAWLEGAALLIEHPGWVAPHSIRLLSRRAYQLAAEPDARKVFAARRIPKEVLQPKIREDVWALYHRGKYDTAVFEAMKAVEVAVREAAGLLAADIGKDLMRKAFAVNSGALTDMTTAPAEQQARSDLFAGAIGSYKNPHSHRNVALDHPDEAAEIIMLANHLLRIVDALRAARAELVNRRSKLGGHGLKGIRGECS